MQLRSGVWRLGTGAARPQGAWATAASRGWKPANYRILSVLGFLLIFTQMAFGTWVPWLGTAGNTLPPVATPGAVQSLVSLSLGAAVDATNLIWTSSVPPWVGQTIVTHDGTGAAESGAVGDGLGTWMQTTVIGPGTISFWWKVSSETNKDFLRFSVGGSEKARISGEVDWQLKTITVSSGKQALRWTYTKNGSRTNGQDRGWVDEAQLMPTPPLITSQPASQFVNAGATVNFKVSAKGTKPLSYQWRLNQSNLFDSVAVHGATNSNLTLSNVGSAQAGAYSVVVSSPGTSVVSSNATLVVIPIATNQNTVLPAPAAIAEAIQRANDYFIATTTFQSNGWARGVYQTGNMRAYDVLGLDRYRQWALDWGSYFHWKAGFRGPASADGQVCGQTYFDLYLNDPQPVRIAAVQAGIDARVAASAVDDWWWIDAFYMAGPVYARFGKLYATNSYVDKMWLFYQDMKVRRGLFATQYGLWYRDEPAKTATTAHGQKQFWGRGNGWVIAALARVIEQLPPTHPRRADFIAMLGTMAAALKPLQGADGMWRASLLDSAEVPNPETSGSALITFGLAWAVRRGYLDATQYQPVVARAWNGMVTLALHPDGKVGYVQPQGREPAPATYESTADHGVGPFLLAGSEVFLLAGSSPPAAGTVVARIAISGGKVFLTWNAEEGSSYQVFYTDNLSQLAWKALGAPTSAVGSVATLSDSSDGQPQRFYRVVHK